MRNLPLPLQPRFIAYSLVLLITAWLAAEFYWFPSVLVAIPLLLFSALATLGTHDLVQTRHAVLRNYPLTAHIRFVLEEIRPEIRQYFLESEKDGTPFSRDKRAIVYQRAKQALDKRPFGTQNDVYASGYEWLHHSIAPKAVVKEPFRVVVGGPDCQAPYAGSVFNISAMSFGALSPNAIRALNIGAKKGGFAHDTGEGGYSHYHREHGGDIIWEVGSGYFSCRNGDGTFCAEKFAEGAKRDQVKMVELKLSQGAKPGHGGVLPGAKVTAEIAAARGVPVGVDCVSPSRHSAFASPIELMQFIATMRRLSGGKPAGFKLCIGHPWEFLAICKAMLQTGIYPDFIVVDGKEGGTGAAPLEFTDHLGMPLREGLNFVHNALVGINARARIKLGASGKIVSAFDMARAMALGANWCNSARGFMFALGCIQSLSCHTDRCPTGVSTQNRSRQRALIVPDKAERVYNFHRSTIESLAELVAAAGLDHPGQFAPAHFSRRVSPNEVKSFAELYPALKPGELIAGTADRRYQAAWEMANAEAFAALPLAA
ncbi:MAG TPA: FMN-binding glutamate synthase family protein [Xanthobacteraceae bacterium]|nr:FMN-binding glutamate synthase family protein [Xanthobacteraceae bacterium]